jgi:MHS family alpha-ketoglutarate permease-like MFS transporter
MVWGFHASQRGLAMSAFDAQQLAGAQAEEEFSAADVKRRLRAIFIGSAGNLVEWYDFYAYAAFAL